MVIYGLSRDYFDMSENPARARAGASSVLMRGHGSFNLEQHPQEERNVSCLCLLYKKGSKHALHFVSLIFFPGERT